MIFCKQQTNSGKRQKNAHRAESTNINYLFRSWNWNFAKENKRLKWNAFALQLLLLLLFCCCYKNVNLVVTISKSIEKPMIHFKFNLRANVRMSSVNFCIPQNLNLSNITFYILTSFFLHHQVNIAEADNTETTKTYQRHIIIDPGCPSLSLQSDFCTE